MLCSALLNRLYLLNALRITINNAKEEPDKHLFSPSSEHPSWLQIFDFYTHMKNESEILWDINGEFRFKNFSSPQRKRLKKKLLVGRCLFCHRKQSEKSFVCDIHSKDNNTEPSKHTIREWIKNSYKYLFGSEYTNEHSKLNIFLKSYELHTWAKWHPVHKEFRAYITGIYNSNKTASRKDITFELEKAYRRHPYINEFANTIDLSQYSPIEAYHSIILESEHTIIKITASKRLRKKYDFKAESIIDYKVKTIY